VREREKKRRRTIINQQQQAITIISINSVEKLFIRMSPINQTNQKERN